MIVYPPLYVFFFRGRKNYEDGMIVKAFILTSFFYFPGLVFAIYVKNNAEICGGLL